MTPRFATTRYGVRRPASSAGNLIDSSGDWQTPDWEYNGLNIGGGSMRRFPQFRSLSPVTMSFCAALLMAAAALAQDGSGLVVASQPGSGTFNEGYSFPEATVDPSTGAAHATIPFSLIPARGSAQPSLNLVYSSAAGMRTAGVGWRLDLPSIERKNLSGPPQYEDPLVTPLPPSRNPWNPSGDRFTFSGQPIVPICQVSLSSTPPCDNAPAEPMPSWADKWVYFRAQVEGAFARMFWSPDGNTWRVELKTGVTLEFGASLVDTASGAPATCSTAVDRDTNPKGSPIFRWNLARQFDIQSAPVEVNLVVYCWSGLGAENNIGYLTDIYDTPRASTGVANLARRTGPPPEDS
jgi:hypothetical protein